MTPTRRTATYAAIVSAMAAPFIAQWEGTDYVAHHARIDPPGVITWCHGNTNYDDPTVKVGTRFTKDECDVLLAKTLPKYLEPIDKCLKVDVTLHNMLALLSASYNAGPKAVCNSSMVRLFNAGEPKAACDAFRGWYVRANGIVLQGLKNRREAERKMCLTEDK